MSPFNSDNSKILLVHQSYFALYDGTGAYLRDLPLEINASSEPRWSRTDTTTLYYVRGNHASQVEVSMDGERTEPWGGIDLHRRVRRDPASGLLMAGIEGSIRYNYGDHQYTQGEMWTLVFGLTPLLFLNRLRYGRYLDIFVTHSPPWKIHDLDDRPHQGIKAFNWLNRVFKPVYHLHGHVHIYRTDTIRETQVGSTRVINTYGYRELNFDPGHPGAQNEPARKEQQA